LSFESEAFNIFDPQFSSEEENSIPIRPVELQDEVESFQNEYEFSPEKI
jgi:hypothetical protein